MKKVFKVAAISLLAVGLSASMAFADTPGRGNANGEQFSNMAETVQERMELKILRIDELVEIHRLTPDQGAAFTALITERMENCTGDTAGQNVKEPLAVGFGRTNQKGYMRGFGNQFDR